MLSFTQVNNDGCFYGCYSINAEHATVEILKNNESVVILNKKISRSKLHGLGLKTKLLRSFGNGYILELKDSDTTFTCNLHVTKEMILILIEAWSLFFYALGVYIFSLYIWLYI